jgi:hypothetical protein
MAFKKVVSSMISLGMTFGNTNEVWAMPKKPTTK